MQEHVKGRGPSSRKRPGADVASKARPADVLPPDLVNGESSSPARDLSQLARPAADVRLIAFYLPQYHPIPENDRWWGKGFTEWNSVVGARPLFDGHEQPHLPADLGFYDLRLPEARQSQVALAREYGIHGFCYYYYWFSGRRLLDRPLEEVLRSGEPDFPFCICWANEPWSRSWDGSTNELLIGQEHDLQTDERFILDVLPILQDARYIRVDGAPLLLIYRVGLLPDSKELFRAWRRIAAEHGIDALHICIAETFGCKGPHHYGADSAVEFPPHGLWAGVINDEVRNLDPEYKGAIYDYRKVVAEEFSRPRPGYLRYRCAMPAWDNTPRRRLGGNVFAYSSPDQYELWLRTLIQDAATRSSPDERLVFINAWNEWGEGAHLEPDHRYGRRYLEATRRALADQSDWRLAIEQLEAMQGEALLPVREIAASLRQRLLALETANRFLVSRIDSQVSVADVLQFEVGIPHQDLPVQTEAVGYLEQVNRYNVVEEMPVLRRDYPVHMKGWCFVPGHKLSKDDPVFISLQADGATQAYSCPAHHRMERLDVVEFHKVTSHEALWSGFLLNAQLSAVDPGSYRVAINVVLKDRVVRYNTDRDIFIL